MYIYSVPISSINNEYNKAFFLMIALPCTVRFTRTVYFLRPPPLPLRTSLYPWDYPPVCVGIVVVLQWSGSGGVTICKK